MRESTKCEKVQNARKHKYNQHGSSLAYAGTGLSP